MSRAYATPPTPQQVLICTQGVDGGILNASWDPATGAIGATTVAAKIISPAFLAFAKTPGGTFTYAVSEANRDSATVSAFAANPQTGALRLINKQPSLGDGPTHVSVSPGASVLAVANYGGGSITTYRILHDGSLSAPVSHIQYTGHGPNADRQESAHAHSVRFTPDGRFLLVNNFGLDQILIYRVNLKTAELTPHTPPLWQETPGSGVRHIAFHPNGRWIYCLNELDSTVEILRWDSTKGLLTPTKRLSSLPDGFPTGKAFSGEIELSHDARNLYIGNRVASETMAVFDVSDDGGSLKLVQLASNGGSNTRHFTIDPSGRWLLLCNIYSKTVVVLERSQTTGLLSAPVHTYPLPKPMFVGFLPA